MYGLDYPNTIKFKSIHLLKVFLSKLIIRKSRTAPDLQKRLVISLETLSQLINGINGIINGALSMFVILLEKLEGISNNKQMNP
ncbi:hypothetical protein HDU67_007441, partial [Dinochytrium kinnereticum]